jgi:hypothetical protein
MRAAGVLTLVKHSNILRPRPAASMPPTPWAILLCRFQDDLTEPHPRAFYEDLFTASGRSQDNVVRFFDDYSLGRVDLGNSQVFGWFTLAQTRAQYTGSGINPQGRWDLIGWARAAAAAAGTNLAGFYGTVVCMNVATDLFGFGGGMLCDPNALQVSILTHEVGHGFGLSHSRLEGNESDYMDRWDVMSTWDSCFMSAHPRWQSIGPGLNAANMFGRGWLDTSRTWAEVPTGGPPPGAIIRKKPLFWTKPWVREIELRPLHRRDLPGFLAARVTDRSGSVQLFFEFRIRERWDAAIPRPAVLAHRFVGNHSYLVPADSDSQDLVVGDTITVYPYGDVTLRVEVLELDIARLRARLLVEERRPRRRVVMLKPKRPKKPGPKKPVRKKRPRPKR